MKEQIIMAVIVIFGLSVAGGMMIMQEYGNQGQEATDVRFSQAGALAHLDKEQTEIVIDLLGNNSSYDIRLVAKGDAVEVEREFSSYMGGNRSVIISLDFITDDYDEVWLEIRNCTTGVTERHRIMSLGG